MSHSSKSAIRLSIHAILAGVATLTVLAGPAAAAILQVANNGADSGTCGTTASPCRSINKAIERASSGDTIEVGPGVYGDIDDDSAYQTLGDERSNSRESCDCMVRVNKTLTIVSRVGATQTVLRTARYHNAPFLERLVLIEAPNVVFGRKDHGFTLSSEPLRNDDLDGGSTAVEIAAAASGATVAGNFLVGNRVGAVVTGETATISQNQLIGNTQGLVVYGAGAVIHGNAVAGNRIGIQLFAQNADVFGNVVTASLLYGVHAGEASAGHETTGAIHGNSIVGNGNGVGISPNAEVGVNGNNLFGNQSKVFPYNGGLVSYANADIDSGGNYWGNPSDFDYALGSGSLSSYPVIPYAAFAVPVVAQR